MARREGYQIADYSVMDLILALEDILDEVEGQGDVMDNADGIACVPDRMMRVEMIAKRALGEME